MQKFAFGLFLLVVIVLFRPVLLSGKILFPSNLLVSSYAPWKYEPVPEYPHGPPNKPIGFDDARQFFPNRTLLRDSFLTGAIPLWNPYIYSGTPFMAAFDTSVWYPLSWIAASLPAVFGWNFLVIVQPILSLFFMYLFLRSLKLEKHVSAFGAFVWAFCGFMVVYWQEILVLEHSFLWLPLALYAVQTTKPKLLVFALACSVFGGFLQMSVYVYIVVILWSLKTKNTRMFWAIALSLVVAAIQLVPSIEAFLMSPRGAADGLKTFQNALLPFQHLMTIIAPDYWGNPATYNYFGGAGFYFEKMIFIGVIPLVFAMYAMGEYKNKQIIFWTILALSSISFGFAIPTSWLPYSLHIPVLSNSYPTRIFGVWAFAASVLSAYGLSSFIKEPRYKRFLWIIGVLSLILSVGWVVALGTWCVSHGYHPSALWCKGKTSILWDFVGHIPAIYKDQTWYASVSLRNSIIPTIFVVLSWLLLLLRRKAPSLVFLAVLVLTVGSGYYFAQKYVYFSDNRFVYPRLEVTQKMSSLTGYNRIWGYGHAFLEKNISQQFRWFSTDGYGNLSPIRYAELLSTIGNHGMLGGAIRRSDTDLYEASEWDAMDANPYRLRMMELLGVRYVLESKQGELKEKKTTEKRFAASLFSLAWENDAWRIWEYKKALPRAFFAPAYVVKTVPQDIVNALYAPETDLATTVILEQNPGVRLSGASGSATIGEYNLNSVRIETRSSGDGFVVLTDNYYPGWTATVDSKPSAIYRADYSLKAVFVPKGDHTVVFQYMPRSVTIGIALAMIGIIATVLL